MLIDSIDIDYKKIYLHSDTVNTDLSIPDLYREIRYLRKTVEEYRESKFPLRAEGNKVKNASKGTKTERNFFLIAGWLIVPYDISHYISIANSLISDDGFEGRDCFYRAELSVGVAVDIDYAPKQVEVITISSGSAVTEQDKIDIANLTLNTEVNCT